MDRRTIASSILKHSSLNQNETDESFRVKAGEVIGKLAEWPPTVLKGKDISRRVKREYGESFDHLHLEVRYVGGNQYDRHSGIKN